MQVRQDQLSHVSPWAMRISPAKLKQDTPMYHTPFPQLPNFQVHCLETKCFWRKISNQSTALWPQLILTKRPKALCPSALPLHPLPFPQEGHVGQQQASASNLRGRDLWPWKHSEQKQVVCSGANIQENEIPTTLRIPPHGILICIACSQRFSSFSASLQRLGSHIVCCE